eukprot:2263734-Amphidinium_carterae.1
MLPRHKSFLPSALPRLKELFGFPTNVPLLQQVALEAQLGQISKLSFDPRVLASAFQSTFGVGSLLDPIRGWRVGGCLASWNNSIKTAELLGIFECRRAANGEKVFVMQKAWTSIKVAITDHFVPNKELIKQRLWTKLRAQMDFEEVPFSFKADR